MKITYTFLNIVLFAFLFSCSDFQSTKNEKAEEIEVISSDSDQEATIAIRDTSDFISIRQLINSYTKKIDSIEKLRIAVYKTTKNNYQLFKDSIQLIESNYYGLLEKRNAEIYNYITKHEKNSDNLEGMLYLVVDKKTPIILIDNLFDEFPIVQRESKLGKMLDGKIEERKKLETLSSYNLSILDLKFEDQYSKAIALHEINSSFILLDFWASWCAPCRYENRILAKKKEKIASFTDVSIVTVSLDTNKDKWLKALNEDGLYYLSICDFKEFESPFSKEFRIKTVPYNVLIDKKGKILANNLWGDNLINFLRQLKLSAIK